MERSHVLYLINNLSTGGTQRIVSELATRLDPDRFKVSLVSVTSTPPERMDRTMLRRLEERGIPVHSLQRHGTQKTLDPIPRLCRMLEAERVDILHTGVFQPDFYGQVAGYLARTPVRVRTFHVTQQWPDSSRWIGKLSEPLLKHLATHNTAVSTACRESVSRELGLSPERIQVIHNAVALDASTDDGADLREALGFGDRPVVAIVGRLAREKGHRTLLLAAKSLADHPRAPLFAIVGDGPDRPELERMVDELGIRHCVRFLGWRSDMPALYRAVDVIVNASDVEGLSMTLLEAMAARKTVVASTIPGNEEIIHHERTGLLFPAGSSEALIQALKRLLDEPALADRLARDGLDLVRREYGLDTMIRKYEALYLSGLQRHVQLRPVHG